EAAVGHGCAAGCAISGRSGQDHGRQQGRLPRVDGEGGCVMFVYYPYSHVVGVADPTVAPRAAVATMQGMLYAIEPGAKFGRPSYTAEVVAFQKAGQYGVTVVGPAIDAFGAAATQPLTRKAWELNGELHTLPTSGRIGALYMNVFGPGYRDMLKA